MRIGLVTESFLPQFNGVVRMVTELLEYLRVRGHEALVFAPGDGPTEYAGFPVRRVPGLPFPPYPDLTLAPFSLALWRDLTAWQPDVLHLASPFLLGFQATLVGQHLGVPVMSHYQTDVPRYAQDYHLGALAEIARRHLVGLHNRCTVTFCPTPSVAAQVRDWGIQRVEVLGRGVDATLFHPARRATATRARYGIAAAEPVLLYVGRLSPEKNLERLRQTAVALPNCRLVVVGDGPERAALAAALPAGAVLTGVLTGPTLADVFAMADVFVFPSLTETFGQVVQEAMASGLPVVAMRAGGVQDLVLHGRTGWLCSPAPTRAAFDEWLAAIVDLISQPALARQAGELGRRQVAGASWTAIFDRMLARYAAELERGGIHVATP